MKIPKRLSKKRRYAWIKRLYEILRKPKVKLKLNKKLSYKGKKLNGFYERSSKENVKIQVDPQSRLLHFFIHELLHDLDLQIKSGIETGLKDLTEEETGKLTTRIRRQLSPVQCARLLILIGENLKRSYSCKTK